MRIIQRKKVDNSYTYLLDIPLSQFTEERIEKLENDIKEIEDNIKYLETVSPKDMWMGELETFKNEYDKVYGK